MPYRPGRERRGGPALVCRPRLVVYGTGGRRGRLAALGVRLQEPEGLACYFVDPSTSELLKEVGAIVVDADEVIEVLPRRGISDDDVRALLGCAEDAFHNRPTAARAWRHLSRQRGTWWSADIVVPVDCGGDAVGRQVARHEASQSSWQRAS